MRRVRGQICIVTAHQYPESIGGEETFVRQFTQFLAIKDLPYKVVSSSVRSHQDGVVSVRLKEFSIPILGYEVYSLIFAGLAGLKIIKMNRDSRIWTIYSVETGHAGLAAVIAGKVLRLPIVVHAHCRRSEQLRRERYYYGGWRAWPYWAIEKALDHFVLVNASKVVVVSDDVENFVRGLGYRKPSLLVARSGIELQDYESGHPEWRKGLQMPSDTFVVGYFGRLHYTKGVHVLIAAFSEFSKQTSKPTLLLIGGVGPEGRRLESLADKLHLTNVKFVGFIPDVKSFLRSISIFVLPSFQEGSPIALLEAMAVGCPTIASDISGISQIARHCAVLFPPGDSKALSNSLRLLEGDPDLRETLSSRSRLESAKYPVKEVLAHILDFCLNSA